MFLCPVRAGQSHMSLLCPGEAGEVPPKGAKGARLR
jgi:hypothetical protein